MLVYGSFYIYIYIYLSLSFIYYLSFYIYIYIYIYILPCLSVFWCDEQMPFWIFEKFQLQPKIQIFRKLFLGVTFESGFYPLNSFFHKKNTCLLFFDKLQHIQKLAKSEMEDCLCSLVSIEIVIKNHWICSHLFCLLKQTIISKLKLNSKIWSFITEAYWILFQKFHTLTFHVRGI